MGECLIADVSLFDVHFQAWMLVVLGIPLCWFIAVWATRSVRQGSCPRSTNLTAPSEHTAISGVSL